MKSSWLGRVPAKYVRTFFEGSLGNVEIKPESVMGYNLPQGFRNMNRISENGATQKMVQNFSANEYKGVMNDLVSRARGFAEAAHWDQKYGEEPYRVHLEEVATLAREYGSIAETLGWLHDTVEDTEVTLDDIESLFGVEIRGMVALLTDEPGHNRKTRKAATNLKLSKVPAGSPEATALIVKACDRLANVRNCKKRNPGLLNMYQREHQAFRAAAFRAGLCDKLWAELDLILG